MLACITFRSLLHWRVFELERTPLFDRIMSQMSGAVEHNTDNNVQLTYWLAGDSHSSMFPDYPQPF